jgi:hypothetical protein
VSAGRIRKVIEGRLWGDGYKLVSKKVMLARCQGRDISYKPIIRKSSVGDNSPVSWGDGCRPVISKSNTSEV